MKDHNLNLNNITAIIFDLGGVILNLDYDLTINRFKKLGGERFDELYTQANQDQIFDAYETGALSSKEFILYLKKFLPGSTTDHEIIDAWNAMLLDLPLERLRLLERLASNFKLYLFSNTNEIHFDSFTQKFEEKYGKKELLDDFFIQTYYSHKVGLRKPNKEAFNRVLEDHNLTPSNVLFIDDSIQHIKGADQVGIKTFHLTDSCITELFK